MAGELYSLASRRSTGEGGGRGRAGPTESPRGSRGGNPALFQFKRSVKVTITIPVRANHLFARCRDAPLIYSRQLIIAE